MQNTDLREIIEIEALAEFLLKLNIFWPKESFEFFAFVKECIFEICSFYSKKTKNILYLKINKTQFSPYLRKCFPTKNIVSLWNNTSISCDYLTSIDISTSSVFYST